MEQLALYREWRPQTFREVIGQEHVCRTLQNAVLMERTAHAYLFCGPRGTGKTSTARILAKALNCLDIKDGEPCNNCLSCQGITDGISLNVIEMDAASHRGIEEIRDLKQKVGMAPSGGRYKVYIIDEVHMLTGEAFNALLKTLEEPPAHAVFILATTEAHKVPLTILSRCQRFDFRRLGRPVIKEHLAKVARAKDWSVEDDALELISRQVSGALRDALGLLDQAASFTRGQIRRKDIELLTGALGKGELEEIIAAVAQGDVPGLLELLDALFARGADPRQVLLQLADQVRDLIFSQDTEKKEQLFYARFLRGIALAEGEMRWSHRPDLLLELTLLRLTGAVSTSGEGPSQQGAGRGVKRQGSADLTEESRLQGSGQARQTVKRQNTTVAIEENRLQKRTRDATGQDEESRNTTGSLQESVLQKRSIDATGQVLREQAASQAVREQAASAQPSTSPVPQRNIQQEAAAPQAPSLGEKSLQQQQKAAGLEKSGETQPPEKKAIRQQKGAVPMKTKEMPSPKEQALPAADVNLDLTAIHDFLISNASEQPILAGVLPKCELRRKGGSLLLLAPSFGCDLIRGEENLKTLQKSLQEYGCSLQLEVALGDTLATEGDNDYISTSPIRDHETTGSELLNMALTIFNGKIIKKKKEGE